MKDSSMKKKPVIKKNSRLEQIYVDEIRPALKKELKLGNIMQVPKVEKIVLNIGCKDAVKDSKAVQMVVDGLTRISGQRAVKTHAKTSISNFKLREGLAIGAMVTLRGKRMYDFLDKLINVSLPRVRDFQGVNTKLDKRGNYNLGIKEWIVFPEVDFNTFDRVYGLNVTIHTSAKTDEMGYQLLKSFGMPFKKQVG